MALSKIAEVNMLLKVKSYFINQVEILGTGAFGTVFKGIDEKKSKIAVKLINGNNHPRILTQDFDRFLQLNHQNVMKILDFDKQDKVLWLFMPMCEHGDLNYFYKQRDISFEMNIKVMKQIMSGIKYLHAQNIVHRDIKPGNILVASEIPLQLLLADFDVSKCLDPEVETSLMTSNVGTLAFKAPEFFQRTSPGQVEYHRNVDIYAAGLTFLAILQTKKGNKMLIPHIETPMDDSEMHAPSIGQLIAERIKYKVSELNIVTFAGSQKSLKWLVSQMTCITPEERLSAAKVLITLDTDQIKRKKLILRRKFPFSGTSSMDVTENDLMVVRVNEWSQYSLLVMRRQTGELINAIPSMCNHFSAFVKMYPQHEDYLLESCPKCEQIRAYNINTGQRCTVYKGPETIIIGNGPAGSVLVVGPQHSLFMLHWYKDHLHEAQVVYRGNIPTTKQNKRFMRFCYVEYQDILICTAKDPVGEISAMKLESETVLWRLSGLVDAVIIQPKSVTCDPEGNVYVSDLATNRILKINLLTGEVLRILLLEEEQNKKIVSLSWSNTEPNLTMRRANGISTYYLPK